MTSSQRQIWMMRVYLAVAGAVRGMTLGVRVMLIAGAPSPLARHTYTPGWQLPGGGVEPGETAEDAACREVLEETGQRIVGRPALFGLYHNLNRATRRDHVALYLARTHEEARPFRPGREIAEAAWFARSALPEETTAGTRRRVAEVFDHEPIAPRW